MIDFLRKAKRKFRGRNKKTVSVLGLEREFHHVVLLLDNRNKTMTSRTRAYLGRGSIVTPLGTSHEGQVVKVKVDVRDVLKVCDSSRGQETLNVIVRTGRSQAYAGHNDPARAPVTMPLSVVSDGTNTISLRVTSKAAGILNIHSILWAAT